VTQAHGSLTEAEVALVERGGLQIGRVIDEHRDTFGRGDFLLRSVLGADRRNGAVAVGDVVPVGTTVQFHLRDARTADEDLQVLLKGCRAEGRWSSPATDGDRGCSRNPTTTPGSCPICSGPCPWPDSSPPGRSGPSAGSNFVHGFTASMALLCDTSEGAG
jgi:small ligand-binding sensory domain FIST